MTREEKRTETKKKLREALVVGFQTKIRKYLLEKGISKSVGKISQVCNPDLSDWDTDIIEAALFISRNQERREELVHQNAKAL